MRYYKIEIDGGVTFTSHAGSLNLPGALLVEMDIPVAPFATPNGAAYVKVWGIPLSMISQAKDLTGKNVKVFGGFQKGLPLANPQQSGLLVQGYIFQSFGNWIGTEQSLDLIILAGEGPVPTQPKNLVLNWKKGASMSDAIKNALTSAYSGFTTEININSKLVSVQDEPGFFASLEAFAAYIQRTSKAIIGDKDYRGVDITLTEKKFIVSDGSSSSGGKKAISFKDLIGQPTWIESPSIQFKTAMRADIKVGDNVTMPPTLVTNSAQAQTSLVNQRASFSGGFQIASVRHVGNSRQPDAASWVSVFNAFPLKTQAA